MLLWMLILNSRCRGLVCLWLGMENCRLLWVGRWLVKLCMVVFGRCRWYCVVGFLRWVVWCV